ncbi:hypothetical protein [Psychrobacter phenylpyruvicus]|uniref:SMI1 / KNR4 family n=1 Tax=Psychrobacter phenylpyruvicus TaxID=29432 RepID=A0A379LJ18_9GAMM|nr:hypothetical protein [Psychrobacter phenylpyruvicus]SUD90599.1 Uncharacterised protein [Psychrobacter phenylpyruvicus]
MSSFNKIELILQKQSYPVIEKKIERKAETEDILLKYGVKKESGFFKLYTKYFLRHLDCHCGADEIVDPLPPQGFSVNFAHEVWQVPKNYILFSTGEGEGGYLYNTEDDSVWDFNLGEQQQLIDGTLPHWNSFYEFMEWYLDTSEGEN